MILTIKGFSLVNEADVFLEFSCFSYDPVDVGSLISGSPAFSESSLNIWMFLVHVLLKPGLENFEHYFASVWDECNCVVVWVFFGIAFLWDWHESWPFPMCKLMPLYSHDRCSLTMLPSQPSEMGPHFCKETRQLVLSPHYGASFTRGEAVIV